MTFQSLDDLMAFLEQFVADKQREYETEMLVRDPAEITEDIGDVIDGAHEWHDEEMVPWRIDTRPARVAAVQVSAACHLGKCAVEVMMRSRSPAVSLVIVGASLWSGRVHSPVHGRVSGLTEQRSVRNVAKTVV